MSNIEQVISAKNVYKWHTQFKGLDMTLDGAALDWFRDLPKEAYTTLDQLEPDFIEAFSLTGIEQTQSQRFIISNNLKQIM